MDVPISFEIPVTDTERAINFYSQVFDWQIRKSGSKKDDWLVTTGLPNRPHTNGLIMKSNNAGSWVHTVEVEALDEQMEKIIASGGRTVSEKVVIPGLGWLAYCQDTEGNLFGIMEHNPRAK
jgi:hypothetical protein